MKRSTDRILVSHAGTLPRPDDLPQGPVAVGDPVDPQRLREAIAEVVHQQKTTGIDIVNDGEYGKRGGFSYYAEARMTGIERREYPEGEGPEPQDITGRDAKEFPQFFAAGAQSWGFTRPRPSTPARRTNSPVFCTGAITYVGQEGVQTDIANFKAALAASGSGEGFLPAIAPGTVEHWLWNEHYATQEEFLFAIADAMHEEYKAITDAGLIVQIDDPDLPDGWQIKDQMTVAEYRKFAEVRVEALNHALRGIPEEQVRLHLCWGSGHGPHKNDIELRDIVDIVLKVNAQCYSVEAGNPRHEHDWKVWGSVKLPEGKMLMPGVVSHISNMIEHPELVAERILKYTNLVGRENVIAGTDCGIGSRVATGEIAWAKLDALVEGARIASEEAWR